MNQKEVTHPQADSDPTARYLRGEKAEPTRRGMKSDSSNPTSTQPPSLLPPMLHQLIYRQGDSNQHAMAWPAVHVHFTHNAGTVLKKIIINKESGCKTKRRRGEAAFWFRCPLTH